MTCILTSRPPWLCPIRIIRRRAGSVPSGSSRATAVVSASRRRRADSAMGLPESYWKNQTWKRLRISGSACSRLNISTQRTMLEAVPWTKTTGMSPGRYGVVETRGDRSCINPVSRPRNPNASISMTGTSVTVSARAAVGSLSSGTGSPAIVTDSLSQARWSSSVPASGSPWTRARRASEIRRRSGHRHLQPRRHHVPPGRRGLEGPGGGGEGGAKAGPAIPHGQAVHLQLRDRGEPDQFAVPGAERRRVEGHRDPPEGQLERAAPRDDRPPVRRGEGCRQRPVVQVRRDPEPGIEPAGGHANPLGEQEGVGVNGGRQGVGGLLRGLAVQERQLGQGEEEVRVPLRRDHRPVQLGQGGRGLCGEGVGEAPLEEHVPRRPARLTRGDGAPAEVGLDDLGVDPDRRDRPRAGRQGQTQGTEKERPVGRHRVHGVTPILPRSRPSVGGLP